MNRPSLNKSGSLEPINAFVAELQEAADTGDSVRFNCQFAQDVLWESPSGAVAVGYDGQWWLTAAQHVPDRRDVYTRS